MPLCEIDGISPRLDGSDHWTAHHGKYMPGFGHRFHTLKDVTAKCG